MTVLTVVLSMVTVSAYAQKNRVKAYDYFPRNEIYVQYGTPSIIELTTILTSEYTSPSVGIVDADSRNHKFSGIVALGYDFSITPKLTVGIDGGFGYGSADFYIDAIEQEQLNSSLFVCRSAINSYTAHLSGSFIYWSEGAMECSGGLYLGICYMDETLQDLNKAGLERYGLPSPKENDRFKFSYHITAVKFRYGETIGGFAELGFGYRGLVNVGLSIKI